MNSTDTPFGLHSVCHTLRSANANLERFAWLGDQLAIAVWTRDIEEAETVYDRPGHHTLSFYLDGGYRTERQKMPGRFGAPTRLCALRRTDASLKGGLSVATRRRLREYIENHLGQTLTLGELAGVAALSEFHVTRMFRRSFGLPPAAWIARQRLERALTLLRTTTLPLAQIAEQCGYANASQSATVFEKASVLRRLYSGAPSALAESKANAFLQYAQLYCRAGIFHLATQSPWQRRVERREGRALEHAGRHLGATRTPLAPRHLR